MKLYRPAIGSCFVASLTVLVAGQASSALAQQGGTTGSPSGRFDIFWCATNHHTEERAGNRWADRVQFGSTPVRRDAIILYEPWLGEYPKAGPHMLLRDPQLMARHMAKITTDLDRRVPRDFTGIAVIDYEAWRLLWERTWTGQRSDAPFDAHDHDFQDDWKETIRLMRPELIEGRSVEQQEAIFKQTYEQTAKDFMLATIRECKRLRPNAKWGLYGYPEGFYTGNNQTARGVFGYGDLSHRASRMNDTLQWLWDELDIITPDIYQSYFTRTDGGTPGRRENLPQENYLFVVNNIAEYERVANGKPMLPFVWMRYHDVMGPPRAFSWVNSQNLRDQVLLTAQNGAEGVIIWEHFGGPWDPKSPATLLQMYNDQFAGETGTVMREAVSIATRPRNNGSNQNPLSSLAAGGQDQNGAKTPQLRDNRTSGPQVTVRRTTANSTNVGVLARDRQANRALHQAALAALRRTQSAAVPLPPPTVVQGSVPQRMAEAPAAPTPSER